MFKKIYKKIFRRKQPQQDVYMNDDLAYLDHLFGRAARTSGFQYLCTILRVEGIKSGHWDAFVEAEETANDFSQVLRGTNKKSQEKRALRMGLFLYCHLTEMSAPYEILANLLLCIQGKPYSMFPFSNLVKKSERNIFSRRYLPYPKEKIEHLRELAASCGELKLLEILDGFFRNDIRNAFYHSDYTITETEFRIIEGSSIGQEPLKLGTVSDILSRCFGFYSAFTFLHNRILKSLAQGKKFHRWPNYEVMELLSDESGLFGFKVHFPTGSHAMFTRKKFEGTMSFNMSVEEQGVSLFVGDLDKYKKADGWYVNGKPFEQYGTRYNQIGFWQPIIFMRDAGTIQQKVREMTDDKTVMGLLFYIFTTGHAAIEFVLKSDKRLNKEPQIRKPVKLGDLELSLCENSNTTNFLYDGTYYLKSKEASAVTAGLEVIKEVVENFRRKGVEVKYRLKYQIYQNASEGKIEKHEDGSFSLTLSMADPRSTLVSNNLGVFPTSDWHIREEWV